MELTQGVRFDTLELSPEILRALMERNIVPVSYTHLTLPTILLV